MVGIALSSCLALLDTVAKSPAASWRMAKACSAPRRGQLLMRTLMQLHQGGRGPGDWFLSGASEPVSAGPQHLGRGAERPGEARPSLQCSRWNAFPGEQESSGYRCPADSELRGQTGSGLFNSENIQASRSPRHSLPRCTLAFSQCPPQTPRQ
uniref:Uncharacterized protein n=1 Tax=Rhinolophus ferrumequinum TaxID=59479 RepID=A0A671EXM2_RHIFE